MFTKKYVRDYENRRSDLIRMTTKFKWIDVKKEQPMIPGLYFTKSNEFRGEVELTQYDGVGNWSTSFKPDYWSEPLIQE